MYRKSLIGFVVKNYPPRCTQNHTVLWQSKNAWLKAASPTQMWGYAEIYLRLSESLVQTSASNCNNKIIREIICRRILIKQVLSVTFMNHI